MARFAIKTNRQPRPLISWHDLTTKEKADFDWLATEDEQSGAEFVRYRGVAYCLAEFTTLAITGTPELKVWDGYHADSHFSGVVMRWHREDGRPDFDRVVMGTLYS